MPDFIIIGAMKSGTTSIHNILAHHDAVFMPDYELYFFDVDDIEQHGDFFLPTASGWTTHDFDRDFDKYLAWYQKAFEPARPDQLVGEDTTTYMASGLAPRRIARLLPEVKLLAILRDPVARAYSHYWHNVAAGRVTMDFDNTIVRNRGTYLSRGYYKEQLERYESFLKDGRLKVILFEDFLADKKGVVDSLCNYLSIENTLDLEKVDAHRNAAKVPLFPPLRFAANRVYSAFFAGFSYRNIPNMPGYDPTLSVAGRKRQQSRLRKLWQGVTGLFPRRRYPPMSQQTRRFLQEIFRKANAGLSDLIGRDVSERWPYMES